MIASPRTPTVAEYQARLSLASDLAEAERVLAQPCPYDYSHEPCCEHDVAGCEHCYGPAVR